MYNFSGISTFDHAFSVLANGVSVLVCLLAAILVFCLKLHRTLVYRLSLYQVLSALMLAVVGAMQIVLINYKQSPSIYGRLCIAIGFLELYTEWMKLLFTTWVTFHLFCFAVLHKNLRKLEVLYVVTSLLVPTAIAIIPLVTHSYGLNSEGDICYIYANTSIAFIEKLALWDGPAMIILIVASTAMVIMVIKMARQVCQRSRYKPITDSGEQFWKALKQLLPLAAFPILFFIFEIPVLIYHVYTTQRAPNEGRLISAIAFFSLWSTASGATVIIHISVARICSRKRKPRALNVLDSLPITFRKQVATGTHANSATCFSLPQASV